MLTTTIVNPKTGRTNRVNVLPVDMAKFRAANKAGEFKTDKDISWWVMETPEVEKILIAESLDTSIEPESSFALSIFENALDWRIGGVVRQTVNAFAAAKRLAPNFSVLVNHKGDLFTMFTVKGERKVYPF